MVGNIRKFIEKKGLIRVNARINAERLNLHNMHITNALGNRTLSFRTTLAGSGTTLNNLIGKLTLDNFVMQEANNRSFKLNHLELNADNKLAGRSIKLLSDFGTLAIQDVSTILLWCKVCKMWWAHIFLHSLKHLTDGTKPLLTMCST